MDTVGPNTERLNGFYAAIFGWEFAGPGPMPGEPPGEYHVARLRGRDVAGVGSLPTSAAALLPAWNTYIRVENAEGAVEQAERAGGSVVVASFDVSPADRMAVLADTVGARFCAWEAWERQGAQLVNEPA